MVMLTVLMKKFLTEFKEEEEIQVHIINVDSTDYEDEENKNLQRNFKS
jgi:hypothetical protein